MIIQNLHSGTKFRAGYATGHKQHQSQVYYVNIRKKQTKYEQTHL